MSLPRDIHGAPPESLVVKLSEVIGNFKTLRKMAIFWCGVVAEVSWFIESKLIELAYLAENKRKFPLLAFSVAGYTIYF